MTREYFGKNFLYTKVDTIDGRVRVALEEQSGLANPFTVQATGSGIKIVGNLSCEIKTTGELQELARLIADIWAEKEKLKVKIVTSASGH